MGQSSSSTRTFELEVCKARERVQFGLGLRGEIVFQQLQRMFKLTPIQRLQRLAVHLGTSVWHVVTLHAGSGRDGPDCSRSDHMQRR